VQMLEQVKSFTTDSGAAIRSRFDEFSKRLKSWLQRPWDAARLGRMLGLAAGVLALGWMLIQGARWSWLRWRRWRRPEAFDPVRLQAGKWLGRLRAIDRSGAVVAELQRLRYGRRETWPEPRGVFQRARQARRAARGR
jgi:protein-glutamine gamma-glutamyltransferase